MGTEIGLKSHLCSRYTTNNKCKPKNLNNSYIIPHIIMFKENLGLNDSISTIWERKDKNRPKLAFSFPKYNKQQLET